MYKHHYPALTSSRTGASRIHSSVSGSSLLLDPCSCRGSAPGCSFPWLACALRLDAAPDMASSCWERISCCAFELPSDSSCRIVRRRFAACTRLVLSSASSSRPITSRLVAAVRDTATTVSVLWWSPLRCPLGLPVKSPVSSNLRRPVFGVDCSAGERVAIFSAPACAIACSRAKALSVAPTGFPGPGPLTGRSWRTRSRNGTFRRGGEGCGKLGLEAAVVLLWSVEAADWICAANDVGVHAGKLVGVTWTPPGPR